MTKGARARLIAEFRGYEEPRQTEDRCKSVETVVVAVAKSFGLGEQVDEMELKNAWKEIVGDFLALHSTPVRFRDGILTVQVLQPTLHYELDRNWKPKLLQNLRERFGKKRFRDIRFRC